jgi:hypothetical protein
MINDKNEDVNKVIICISFPARLVTTILIGAILITSISAATHVFAVGQTSTTLPSCTDPTGQNLPCMMVISTLPPPPNAIQCQETSGQILPCSYATQNLSNGEQIVAITVYVPANYVFTGYGPWTVVKQVVHETKTIVVHGPQKPGCERPDANAKTDPDTNLKTKDCDLGDANEHVLIPGCEPQDANAKTDPDTSLKTKDCDLGDANEHINLPCERTDANARTDPDTNLKTKDCDLGDANEHIKLPCERTDANAKTDPDTGLKTMDCDLGDANEHIKTPLPASCNSANNNGTCLVNNNTKVATSVGKGGGPSCVNNCTTGTPPPVDCQTNPNDPSCTQTLKPSTTSPATKTCPDGSVIDASANCPTQTPSPPPTNNNPPPSGNSNPTPPSDNNPPPGSGDKSNNNPQNGGNDNTKSDKSNGGNEGSSGTPNP